jgi:uncharacterized protein (DUF736 family)
MSREDEIGALWIKNSSKGEFMTGKITINGQEINVVAFPNDHKSNDRSPDWRLLKAKPREPRD